MHTYSKDPANNEAVARIISNNGGTLSIKGKPFFKQLLIHEKCAMAACTAWEETRSGYYYAHLIWDIRTLNGVASMLESFKKGDSPIKQLKDPRQNPLHIAIDHVDCGYEHTLQAAMPAIFILTHKIVKPDWKDSQGRTPLEKAVLRTARFNSRIPVHSHVILIEKLLKSGASVKSDEPLVYNAINLYAYNIAQALIFAEADVNKLFAWPFDGSKQSALNLARKQADGWEKCIDKEYNSEPVMFNHIAERLQSASDTVKLLEMAGAKDFVK